jgi:preprotein translocase subunit SecG
MFNRVASIIVVLIVVVLIEYADGRGAGSRNN